MLVTGCVELEKKTHPPSEQQREDVVEARRQGAAAQLNLDSDRVVFIVETWAKTNMTRTYGRTPAESDWPIVCLMDAGRRRPSWARRVRQASWPRSVWKERSTAHCSRLGSSEQHLSKVLRLGDVVVMDNPSSHKGSAVAAAIEAVGAELRYLPPYSPALNPIELAFSKFKKLLRDGAERTNEKLWLLCGKVLDLFTETECRNCIAHC